MNRQVDWTPTGALICCFDVHAAHNPWSIYNSGSQYGGMRRIERLTSPCSPWLGGLNVFIDVRLERQTIETVTVFENAIRELPEVTECYLSPRITTIYFTSASRMSLH